MVDVLFLLNLLIGLAIAGGCGYWGWRVRREYSRTLGTVMLAVAGFGVLYLVLAFLSAPV